ncbi:MAG: hypothetical protein HYX24_05660 [Candidatus Aenigmarchaeota archaeon]|nr:hypothetical protein [Candidatus Aenigmarchaeota archaeon]
MRKDVYAFSEKRLYENADEATFWGIPLSVIDHLGRSEILDPNKRYDAEATEGGHVVFPKSKYEILPNYKRQQDGLGGAEVLPYLRKAFSGMLSDARKFMQASDKEWVVNCMSQKSDVWAERSITGYHVTDPEQEWQEIVLATKVSGKVVLFFKAQMTEKL